MLKNCTYGKEVRLTQTKDASWLSSAVCLTKWRSIIRSPSRRLTLPYCVIGWSSFMTDWMAPFWTPKCVAKQVKTLFCIAGGKVLHCLGASVYILHEWPVTGDWQSLHKSWISLVFSFWSGSRHSVSCRSYNSQIWLSCAVAVTNKLIDGYGWHLLLIDQSRVLQCHSMGNSQ